MVALATQHGFLLHQMDVKTAFLNGVSQPPRYLKKGEEDKVSCLPHLESIGFTRNLSDQCVFLKKQSQCVWAAIVCKHASPEGESFDVALVLGNAVYVAVLRLSFLRGMPHVRCQNYLYK